MMRSLTHILLASSLLFSISAQGKKSELVELQDQLQVIEKSLGITRSKIKQNRDLTTLPDLYMTLADFQIQKSSLSYSIKRVKNPKTPIDELDTTQEKRMKEEAIETYNLVVTRFITYRDVDRALFFLAGEYKDLGQQDKALQSYKKLIDQFPKSQLWDAAQFAIGNHYFEKKDFAFAREQFQKILIREENAYTALAQFRIAWCSINQSKWKLALDQFEKIYHSESKVVTASMPGATAPMDVKEEALIASVWPYLELSPQEAAKRTDLADPVVYYQKNSPDDRVYLKVLQRLAHRLEIKKRHHDSARALYLALQLTSISDEKVPVLEEFYLLNRDQKLAIWPLDYVDQIKLTFENADAKTKKKYEPLVRDVATQLHTLGQSTKRSEDLAQAVLAYEVYLYLYPKGQNSAAMSLNLAEALFQNKAFIPSALEYEKLALKNKADRKGLINSALQAFMEGVKISDKLSRLDRVQAQTGFDKLSQYFLKTYPTDKSIPAIEFNIAKLAFDRRDFDRARKLLRAYLTKYPAREESEQSALLLLDSFYQENDLKNLSAEGRRLLASSNLKPSIKTAVKDLVEKAQLRTVRNIAGNFDSKEYSQNLLKLSQNSKDSGLGESALYEAFLSAKSRKDPQTYSIGETYLGKYGSNDKAKSIDLELIQMALRSADFRLAARYLEGFAVRHPHETETASYMTQAETIYSQLASIDDLKRITARTGHKEILAKALFLQKRWSELAKLASEIQGVAGSYYQGVALYRSGDRSASLGLLNRTADANGSSAEDQALIAHARFLMAQLEFEKVKGKLTAQTLSPALLKNAANEAQGIENSLRRVLDMQQGRWVVGSLYLLGELQLQMANFLIHGQPPAGVSAAQLQKALSAQVQKAQARAKEYFAQCKQVATEKKIYTHYLAGCLDPSQKINEANEFLTASTSTGASDASLPALRQAVASRSEDTAAWMKLAERLFSDHAYADCHLVLSRLVESSPQMAQAYAALGIVRLYLGDIDSSTQSLKKAEQIKPNEPLATFALQSLDHRYSLSNGRQPASRRPPGVWSVPDGR